MTHENHGKRWPPTAGVEADYITVDTHGPGSAAAARLRLYGIPHSTVAEPAIGGNYGAYIAHMAAAETVEAGKPPTLEGWSFSVYNGAEEHASGWGSASLADMAPALLAAIGMTDAATANKRAQVAEQRAAQHAADRDGAVEALDIANDMTGKLCAVMAGAGFTGDLLAGIQHLIKQRDAAEQERKDMSAILKRWEDFVRGYLPTVTLTTNATDRHFDLRVALGEHLAALTKESAARCKENSEREAAVEALDAANRKLELVSLRLDTSEGDNTTLRSLLDKHTEQRDGTRLARNSLCDALAQCKEERDDLRMKLATRNAENFTLRDRLSLCAEREDQTIAALGHPCSTNGIPEAVRLLRRDAERWLTECGEVGARAVAYSAESVRLTTQLDDARAEADHLRSSLAAADSVVRLVTAALETPEGVLVTEHAANVMKQCERAAVLLEEVTRLNRALENTGGYGARERAKTLAVEVTRLERLLAKTRAQLGKWHTWGRNKIGVADVVSGANLRTAIDAYYAEAVFDTRVPSDDCRAAVDYLIAHPGRGLTAELAHEGAKTLRQRLENGLPYTHPLRYLIDMALSAGVNAAHNMWDAEVQRTRDEAAKAYKRLDQWIIWGYRAACVINADDNTLRSEIDKALPMWRRGTPEV